MENQNDLSILEEAKVKYDEVRSMLYKIIDQKFKDNTMSYYIRKKSVGSKTIQQLKHNPDKLLTKTIIKALERMQ